MEDFPYGMCGTGFLVRSKFEFFFVTAKHILRSGDHERLRVARSFASSDIIELGQYGYVKIPEAEEDTDWADIAIFSVVPDVFGSSGDNEAVEPAYVPESDTRHLLQKRVILTVRGFPAAAPLSRIEFAQKRIIVQPLTSDAYFVRPTESVGCYELQFVESCPIRDFNFMSGSPVFAKMLHNRDLIWILVGVLLRAGGPERLGRFVSIEIAKRAFGFYADPGGPTSGHPSCG